MKQKTNGVVTKSFLKQELKREFDSFEKKMDTKLDKLGEENNKLGEENKGYRDEVLTKLDEIVGELEVIRDDRVLAVHQTSEIQEQVADHEKRIKRIEKLQPAA